MKKDKCRCGKVLPSTKAKAYEFCSKKCKVEAAAPELLAACKQLVDVLEDHEDAEVCSHANSLAMGRAAIANAEGRGAGKKLTVI